MAEDMNKPFSIENPITYQGNINASVTLADLSPFVPAFRHFKEPLTLQLAIEGKGKHDSDYEPSDDGDPGASYSLYPVSQSFISESMSLLTLSLMKRSLLIVHPAENEGK